MELHGEVLRLLSAMGMVWEASTWLDAEVVEHQEGREVAQLRRPYGPTDAGTCALGLFDGKEDLANGAWDRHLVCDKLLGWVIERRVGRVRGGGGRRLDVTRARIQHGVGGVSQDAAQLLCDGINTGYC